MFDNIEEQVRASVEWLRLLVEALGALVIGVSVLSMHFSAVYFYFFLFFNGLRIG